MREIFKPSVIERMSRYTELSVAIHSFNFHADDIFSIALLKALAKVCNFKLNIIRTRDEDILKKVDMRVDVGKKYSEETLDFDHHQKDPSLMQKEGIKHSAFGLLCKWCMKEDFLQIYKRKYILGIEHQDNTGRMHEYYGSLGYFVHTFLPAYGEDVSTDKSFEDALVVAEIIFERSVRIIKGIFDAEKDLNTFIIEKLSHDRIIVLNRPIYILPELHPYWKFVISPHPSGGWSFTGMNGGLVSNDIRGLDFLGLKERGVKGKFIHIGGFTGILDELEDVKEICINSLNLNTYPSE